MSIIGIDHVQLAMPEGQEEQARRFYRDVLGVPERRKPADMAKRGGCWFENDLVKIHLGVEKDFRAATKAHPGLLVRDLKTIAELCRQNGHEVHQGPAIEGFERIFVNDPFGNRIELLQRLSAPGAGAVV
jgi:catechol 2,3-dioxygenase-like lactoylglutathione lyase family enzyme